ncbi:MAG: hypothetical protein JSS49_12535 [Planctomycetes bacterium]|nr:hypothetical protein [Planctomycetota bacterium]
MQLKWLSGSTRFVAYSALVFAYCVSIPQVHGENDDVNEVANSCVLAIEAIETVQAGVLNAVPRSVLPTKAEVTDTGNLVLNDFTVAWDRSSGCTLVEGRFFTVTQGVGLFTPFKGAYNGKVFKTINTEIKNGQIIEAGANLSKFRHVALLLGYGVIEHPTRDVAQVLASGPVSPAKGVDSNNGFPVLEVKYSHHEGSSQETPMLLRVFVDPDHDALPARIQCIKVKEQTLHTEVVVSKFHRTSAGLWVPIRGTLQLFDVSIHAPPGYTFADVVKMPMEERKRIGANYIPAPIDLPEEIIIATHDLHVNSKLSTTDLDFEFPEGAIVFDSFNNVTLKAGADGSLRPNENTRTASQDRESRLESWSFRNRWLIGCNAVAVCLIVFGVAYRRRRQ